MHKGVTYEANLLIMEITFLAAVNLQRCIVHAQFN